MSNLTASRATFEQMDAAARAAFFKRGGVLFDDKAPESKPLPVKNELTRVMNRSYFDNLEHSERAAYFKNGWTITD